MNQLKKIFMGSAVVVALGFIGANNASAQVNCTAQSQPALVRATGLAELTGSVVLSCTSVAATAASSITVSIQPATAVITNNPTGATATPVCAVSPAALGNAVPTVTFSQGAVALGAANSTVCTGVVVGNTITFPTLATVAAGAFTITVGVAPGFPTAVGIRANISASGVVFPAQVQALITSAVGSGVSVTNNVLSVAIPQPGLATTFGTTPGLAQCGSANVTGGLPSTTNLTAALGLTTQSAATVTGAVTVVRPSDNSTRSPNAVQLITVTEGFPSAWAIAGAGGANGPGEGADSTQGTRIEVDLTGYPSNLIIAAPNYLQSAATVVGGTTTQLGLVTGTASPAPLLGALAAPFGGLTIVTGSSLVYEVTSTTSALTESINIPLIFFTTGTVSPAGTVTAAVGLAPVSTVGTAINSPIPRFAASTTTGNALTVIPCLTNIFVPFATNQVGFDTGIAVANTTADIFGTTAQAGTCVYNFYGANAPSGGTFTTSSVAAGTVDAQLVSKMAPNFQGYIIIQCNFQLGHGFFFTVNGYPGGAATIAQGGAALIMLQPATNSNSSATGRRGLASAGPAAFGEALGH